MAGDGFLGSVDAVQLAFWGWLPLAVVILVWWVTLGLVVAEDVAVRSPRLHVLKLVLALIVAVWMAVSQVARLFASFPMFG